MGDFILIHRRGFEVSHPIVVIRVLINDRLRQTQERFRYVGGGHCHLISIRMFEIRLCYHFRFHRVKSECTTWTEILKFLRQRLEWLWEIKIAYSALQVGSYEICAHESHSVAESRFRERPDTSLSKFLLSTFIETNSPTTVDCHIGFSD